MTQEHIPELRMEKALREYFQGEKTSGQLLMLWALISLLVAGYFVWQYTDNFFIGAATPVGLIASIHLTAGATLYLRSGKLLEMLISQLQEQPERFLTQEPERMNQVMTNFENYKLAEQILFLLGCGFVAGGAFLGGGEYMLGSGTGICIQSALTLVFDLFAAFRGGLYLHELKVFKRER